MESRLIRLFKYLKTPVRFTAASVAFSIVLTLAIMFPLDSGWAAIRFGLMVAIVCSSIASYVFASSVLTIHTLLEERNRQLAEAIAELEQRNGDLEAFAHTVAHDLKSPLSIISGYADVLRLKFGQVDPDTDAMLDYMWRAGYKMEEIIDALLLLASVSRESVIMEPLNMKSLVGQALERLGPMIQENGAKIVLPPAWPDAVGYAPWVEGIWVHYISNGLKYGGNPPVITLDAEEEQDGTLSFSVSDNGHGIAPEDLAELFQEFSRPKNGILNGHGLGLSIVRRIAARLHGKVGVESEVGAGSRFFFTLPAAEHGISSSPALNQYLSLPQDVSPPAGSPTPGKSHQLPA